MVASCAAREPTWQAKARPTVGAPRNETATTREQRSQNKILSARAHKPAATSIVAARLNACQATALSPYLPHLRRIWHTEAKVDRHIADDAQHAHASVLQLRLRADAHASGQVDAASRSSL